MSTKATTTDKAKDKRDEVVAHKRAFGSLVNEIDNDAERVRAKASELHDAIERLNERYINACQRREAIKAAGEDPGPVATPISRVGVIELPTPMEHPPRKRANLRRTEEEKKAIEERRREEYARSRFAELPNVSKLPADIPLGSL